MYKQIADVAALTAGKEGASMAEPVRVLVVDDFRISRSFFEMYVRSSSRYALAGSLSLAEEALDFCERHPVNLVIMDVMMRSGTDGLTVAARLKERRPEIKVILCTSAAETSWEEKARAAGIESFWYKEYSTEPLLEVMDRTAAGERVYPSVPPELRFGDTTRANLTDRELDVLRELTSGYTNEEIARRLGVTVNTVRYHIQNMLNKTGFENRLDLAINAKGLWLVVSDQDLAARGAGAEQAGV